MRHHHHPDFRGGRFAEMFSLHALWHAMGRHSHGGGHGFGRGRGHGFGGSGEEDSMPRARRISSDDLQLLLLCLLEKEPRHGYELIKALEAHSNGFYAPSPGMVYPALTYLEELRYVTVEQEGNRKRYAVADDGRAYLAERRQHAEMLLARLAEIGRKMDSVRRAFAGESGDEEADGHGWHPELATVRYALKRLIFKSVDLPASRQREIAAILRRALEEIEQLDHKDAG